MVVRRPVQYIFATGIHALPVAEKVSAHSFVFSESRR